VYYSFKRESSKKTDAIHLALFKKNPGHFGVFSTVKNKDQKSFYQFLSEKSFVK
jgi:hypothetical protein